MFPFLYPLKTPENQRFSEAFRGSKMGTLARNRIIRQQTYNITIKKKNITMQPPEGINLI